MLKFTPGPVARGSSVAFFTDTSLTTPTTDLLVAPGTDPVPSRQIKVGGIGTAAQVLTDQDASGVDGVVPAVYQAAASPTTLYLAELDYNGAPVTSTKQTLTGVDPQGAPAGGTSVASYAQFENTSATVLPSAGTATLIPLTLDSSGGTDITLDADGHTVVLAEAGVYSVSAELQTNTGHTVTAVMLLLDDWDPFPLAGKYGEDFGNRKVPRADGAVVRYGDLYRVAAGARFAFYAAADAATDCAVSWLGIDVIRLV
jgi:hypothetical protein